MFKSNFKAEFLHQLNNTELSFDQRLHMAYGAVIAPNFPLPGKEQLILDWFADCVKINPSLLKSILKILIKCLKSERLLTHTDSLDATKLIEAIADEDDETKNKCCKQLISFLLLLLKNAGFQRHCRFDIQPICQAAVLTCNLVSLATLSGSSGDNPLDASHSVTSVLDDLFECIYNIHKITQQRCELKSSTIKFILPTLLKCGYKFDQSEKFQIIMEEVVFGEDPEQFCEAFKVNAPKRIPENLKLLVNLMTENKQQCDVILLYSLVFNAYISSCLKKSKSGSSHLSMFYILTAVCGFQLQLPYNTLSCSSEITSKRLSILNELVWVLQKQNISTSSESEEGILSNLLITIQKQLISDHPLSPSLLKAVNNIFNICPESVRQVFSLFIVHIAISKKTDKEVLKSYNTLLMDMVKTFSDLNQLEKFFSLFLQGVAMILKDHNFLKLSKEMVLTDGFYTVLSEKLPSLTGNHLKTIIESLEKTFSNDVIAQMTNYTSTDTCFSLLTSLIVQVICHIMENSSIIMSTRWNIIGESVNKLILAIQRFGIEVMKCNESQFLLQFLQLVRAVTDLELAMNQYVISFSAKKMIPVVKSKDKTSAVYNLSKSHGFLPAQDWKSVSELVSESYDKHLTHCWNDLLVQKYTRLGDPEVITHIVLSADSEWLWRTVRQVSVSVPMKHLELYTEHLIGGFASADDISDKLSALSDINIVTNRVFRTAVNLQSIKLISKTIPNKNSLSRNLIKLIDTHYLLKFEAEFYQHEKNQDMSVIVDALVEVINTNSCDNPSVVLSTEAKDNITRLLEILTVMNPHCLKNEIKRIIFLLLISLSYDLKSETSLLSSILDTILGCMDDSSSIIPESLDRRILVHWLVTVVPSTFLLRQELMELALNKVLHSIDKCVDGMSEVVQSDEDVLCAMLETLSQVHGKGFRSKEEYHKVMKKLIFMATSVVSKKPKRKYLRLYTTVFKAESTFIKEKHPTSLSVLQEYLDLLFGRLAENSVVMPNATELIDTVINVKTEVDAEIIDQIYNCMTLELCKTELCPILCYPSTVKSFLESLPADRFENILSEIYKCQMESLNKNKEVFSVGNVCELWNLVVSAHVDKGKAKIRQKMLARILNECQYLLVQDLTLIQPIVLQLLHSIVLSKSVFLVTKLLDPILVILGVVPTDTEVHLLPECLSVLSALIRARPELLLDRIPPFLQRLRKFIKSLVLSSSGTKDNLAFTSLSSSSVNQVTRIIKTMTDQHSKHFARIAPYLIADILQLLVSYMVEASIKVELQICVCSLLSICDHHGTQLLQNLLPVASIELFKSISTTYRKSYKYTGKV